MYSLILSTASRYLLVLLQLFAVFLLLRGHNEPGGGFAAGLVAAAGHALYFIANGLQEARRLFRFNTLSVAAVGLLTALLSILPSLFLGLSFMQGVWIDTGIELIGKVGTPLLFDLGVFLLVQGITLTILFTLAEVEECR